MPRLCPLFWQFHGFPLLLMVVGWVVFFSFFSPSSTHIANSPRGSLLKPWAIAGPLTTAAHSDGADQASPWCSPPAPEPSVLLNECGSTKATPRGQAEGERVPCLLKLEPSRKPLPTFTREGDDREGEEGCTQPRSSGVPPILETPRDWAEKPLPHA